MYPHHYVHENLSDNGWRKYLLAPLEIITIDSDHNHLLEPKQLVQIKNALAPIGETPCLV